jgi:uncharacterized protein YdcH (DUF465 family)
MSEHQQHHLEKLLKEHQQLDKQIDQLEFTRVYDDTRLEQLKKHRLHVKDEIAKLQLQLQISSQQ